MAADRLGVHTARTLHTDAARSRRLQLCDDADSGTCEESGHRTKDGRLVDCGLEADGVKARHPTPDLECGRHDRGYTIDLFENNGGSDSEPLRDGPTLTQAQAESHRETRGMCRSCQLFRAGHPVGTFGTGSPRDRKRIEGTAGSLHCATATYQGPSQTVSAVRSAIFTAASWSFILFLRHRAHGVLFPPPSPALALASTDCASPPAVRAACRSLAM